MAKGDHIKVRRSKFKCLGYWHHGIDCGDGTVIHYGGKRRLENGIHVQRVTLDTFLDGGRVVTIPYTDCYPSDLVVKNAETLIGEKGFSTVFNNCEHFARFCKTGSRRSKQVRKAAALCSAVLIYIIGLTTDFISFTALIAAGCGLFIFTRMKT